MRRRHAISPDFSGHYQDLGMSSLKRSDSASNIILSVDGSSIDMFEQLVPGITDSVTDTATLVVDQH